MMAFIYITLVGLIIFIIFMSLLIWSIKSGQMDELDLPADKALWDDQKDV